MPYWITWPGIIVGIAFIIWGLLPNHRKIQIRAAILFIARIAGITGNIASHRIATSDKIEKKISTKIIASILALSPSTGFLTMKISFTNDGNIDYQIDTAYMITMDRNSLLMINESNMDLGDIYNNINNMLNHDKISILESTIQQKPNFPKLLKPGDLWVSELKEPFDLKNYFEEHNLINIKRMPIGVMVRIIDYKGTIRFAWFYNSEIVVREDGENYIIRTIHKPIELILK